MEDSVVHELMVGVVLLSVALLQELTVGEVFDSVLEDWILVVFDSVVDPPQPPPLDEVEP